MNVQQYVQLKLLYCKQVVTVRSDTKGTKCRPEERKNFMIIPFSCFFFKQATTDCFHERSLKKMFISIINYGILTSAEIHWIQKKIGASTFVLKQSVGQTLAKIPPLFFKSKFLKN